MKKKLNALKIAMQLFISALVVGLGITIATFLTRVVWFLSLLLTLPQVAWVGVVIVSLIILGIFTYVIADNLINK